MLYDGTTHSVLIVSLLLVFSSIAACTDYKSSFTPDHIRYLQNETRILFKHGWHSYIDFGFPADEVRPLTCEPYGPDWTNVDNTIRNDAMGNFSSTVLDNLDTLIIMEEWEQLSNMLSYLKTSQDIFEQDTVVQVFESSIRSLGGLLSVHLLLTDVTNRHTVSPKFQQFKKISEEYDGFLLNMAYDLGLRLIPTYKTSTNVPVPRVNLAKGVRGVPARLQKDACTAGATTPVLEFTLLSKLTGDPQFEYYTQLTFWKLWSSKSALNLLPMTIDPISNQWKDALSGIGASIDSFYEYAAKGAIIFDDDYMWSVFKTSYKALLVHSAQGGSENDGTMIFPNVGINDGVIFSEWIDSLGAFWAGLQVITGQVSDAIKTHNVYLKIWDYFESLPERWAYSHYGKIAKDIKSEDSVVLEWYPLRPEFIESTYYLYRATRDPMYLQIGERILNLYKTKFKAKCGFSGIQDVRTGEKQNRMETFVLGETLKYLYLLFDTKDESFLHSPLMNNKNWVFSTEAHPLWFNKRLNPLNKKNFSEGEVLHFEKPLFQSFMSKLNKFQSKKQNLIDSHDTSFYRNITLAPVPDFKLPGGDDFNYLMKVDPFDSRFDVCELNPFTKHTSQKRSFMISGYYAWNRVFDGDSSYNVSLIKPGYLNQSSLDGTYIELTKDFYEKFTLFGSKKSHLHLQCARASNTERMEVMLGDINLVNQVEVSKLIYNNTVARNTKELIVLENDLWVPEIQALKMTIEKLKIGQIDSRNRVVTEKYIESVRPDDFQDMGVCDKNDKRNFDTVLRITKLNGVFITEGTIIWTLPFNIPTVKRGEIPVVDVASDGRVKLQGEVVENLMVWYD